MVRNNLVPPDGGWGWFIMIAYAIYHFIYMPILQNFGLVFKDTFKEMELSATDGSIIINTNSAVCMFMGLANGPLLKRYSFRKVSIVSAVFIGAGLIATAFARSFTQLIATYGLITSIGVGLGMCSYPLALNTYFLKKRSKVTGLALAITGLGSIGMPQIITALINHYGIEGALLIIAGISLNTFVAAVLLQPVKRHTISVQESEVLEDIEQEKIIVELQFEEDKPKPTNRLTEVFKYFLANVVENFDLSLLKDPQYVILMLGLAFTLFSEFNFSLLTPFILSDVGLSTAQIATFLSVLSTADLVLRFGAPFIGDFFNLSARVLFMISLVILSLTRLTIVYFTSFQALLTIAVVSGIAKGVRTVYWSLILPEYLPLDKLSSALSLEMVINGIVVLGGGPLLGIIRDITGSYANSIHIMNFLTILTVLMWSIEMFTRKWRCKQSENNSVDRGES